MVVCTGGPSSAAMGLPRLEFVAISVGLLCGRGYVVVDYLGRDPIWEVYCTYMDSFDDVIGRMRERVRRAVRILGYRSTGHKGHGRLRNFRKPPSANSDRYPGLFSVSTEQRGRRHKPSSHAPMQALNRAGRIAARRCAFHSVHARRYGTRRAAAVTVNLDPSRGATAELQVRLFAFLSHKLENRTKQFP